MVNAGPRLIHVMFITLNLEKNGVIELLTYYVISAALIIGAPAIFFLIVFMPSLQNTKGRMVGYKMREEGECYWMKVSR